MRTRITTRSTMPWTRIQFAEDVENGIGPQESGFPGGRGGSACQQTNSNDLSHIRVWIDGVGVYRVIRSSHVCIGGPDTSSRAADLALLANLSRHHARIIRDGSGYFLEAHSPTRVGDRVVHERVPLSDRYDVTLNESVQFQFRLPTALSCSANLTFLSDHRPADRIDGVVLMDDTCLLGPGGENHIPCPNWMDTVILFQKGQELWCKSRLELFVDGVHVPEGGPVGVGSVVTGPDLRFRIESAA